MPTQLLSHSNHFDSSFVESGRASEDDLSEKPSCHEDAEEPHSSGPKQVQCD